MTPLEARNFAPKVAGPNCELCRRRHHGQQRFVLEDHVLCKAHFTGILTAVSAKIVEYNGLPLAGITRLVKDLERELKARRHEP